MNAIQGCRGQLTLTPRLTCPRVRDASKELGRVSGQNQKPGDGMDNRKCRPNKTTARSFTRSSEPSLSPEFVSIEMLTSS